MICEGCGNDDTAEGHRLCSDCLEGCVECGGPGPFDVHGQCCDCADELVPHEHAT